jgi:ubiquinone/menaquinone biosynthesis C-methylase UbiE
MGSSRIGKIALGLASVAMFAAGPIFSQDTRIEANKLAPYVPSPQPIVERMLMSAGLKANETLYDLGCGDGRILITAARRFGANAVGVEISKQLVDRAQKQVDELSLENKVQVIYGDLMKVNVSSADVVALYLLTHSNDQLRPKLERELKNGARVVSLDYKIRGWEPISEEKVQAYHRPYTIYVYEVPKSFSKNKKK